MGEEEQEACAREWGAPALARSWDAGRRQVFLWDGARRSGNTCGVPWLLAWIGVMAPHGASGPLSQHALAPRGAGAFLWVPVNLWVSSCCLIPLGFCDCGGWIPTSGSVCSPPVPANSWLQSLHLHPCYSLPARRSWDGPWSPPGAPLPLATATFLQHVPSQGSGAIPGARVPRLAPALACVVPPAHRNR